ncbi:MAG: FAD-binding oxidoreductase [Woeseiaceae bacterium]
MSEAFLSELREIVGDEGWVSESAQLPFLREWRGDYKSTASTVVCPSNVSQVSAIVALCARAKVAVVPQGGNTGLCGGAVAERGQVILSLTKMNAAPEVFADDDVVQVEAGCLLADIQAAAAAHDRLFPLSLSAEGSCQIGGNLSTNAGGVNFVRYGGARDQVLGLQVVLANGRIIDDRHHLRKNNAGYDWKHWFIGAEGTLGVVTAASLKLWPKPQKRLVAWLSCESLGDVVSTYRETMANFGSLVSAFELISDRACRFVERRYPDLGAPSQARWSALIEWHGSNYEIADDAILGFLAGLQRRSIISEAIIAQSESQAERFWQVRHAISSSQRPEGVSFKHDIALPLSKIASFAEQTESALLNLVSGLRPVCFGHMGDGNLHYNISQPRDMDAQDFLVFREPVSSLVHKAVLGAGGTISAEHGIGMKKREWLRTQIGDDAYQTMLAQKRMLDPDNIMNPGKVL